MNSFLAQLISFYLVYFVILLVKTILGQFGKLLFQYIIMNLVNNLLFIFRMKLLATLVCLFLITLTNSQTNFDYQQFLKTFNLKSGSNTFDYQKFVNTFFPKKNVESTKSSESQMGKFDNEGFAKTFFKQGQNKNQFNIDLFIKTFGLSKANYFPQISKKQTSSTFDQNQVLNAESNKQNSRFSQNEKLIQNSRSEKPFDYERFASIFGISKNTVQNVVQEKQKFDIEGFIRTFFGRKLDDDQTNNSGGAVEIIDSLRNLKVNA